MKSTPLFCLLLVLTATALHAQTLETARTGQPDYTPKQLVSGLNRSGFKNTVTDNGFAREYLSISPILYDVDDHGRTRIQALGPALVCVEGTYKQGKKNGLFTFYVIDSLYHSKRYKIWEQDIVNDQLHGQWKTFDLAGNLVQVKTFSRDSLHGISREYWINGTVTEEREYFNGRMNYNIKQFNSFGKLDKEGSFVNGLPEGVTKDYYPSGTVMDEYTFKKGVLNGRRKYYYPSGKVWIETEYQNGKPWTIIGNYDETGKKRDAGTLLNGNGTVLYYNANGTLREAIQYKDGVEIDR